MRILIYLALIAACWLSIVVLTPAGAAKTLRTSTAFRAPIRADAHSLPSHSNNDAWRGRAEA